MSKKEKNLDCGDEGGVNLGAGSGEGELGTLHVGLQQRPNLVDTEPSKNQEQL